MIKNVSHNISQQQWSYPLVSCIMPTRGREPFVYQSIQYILQQDYLNKELIIVFDHLADIPAIAYPENIKLIQAVNTILGAKRNEACRYAQGAIIVHWDDDENFSTNRANQWYITYPARGSSVRK